MAIGEFRIRINNRKVLKGLLQQFEVPEEKAAAVLRVLDKAEKEEPRRFSSDWNAQGARARGCRSSIRFISAKSDTDETLEA